MRSLRLAPSPEEDSLRVQATACRLLNPKDTRPCSTLTAKSRTSRTNRKNAGALSPTSAWTGHRLRRQAVHLRHPHGSIVFDVGFGSWSGCARPPGSRERTSSVSQAAISGAETTIRVRAQQVYDNHRAIGRRMSGAELARQLGTSEWHGRRLLAEIRTQVEGSATRNGDGPAKHKQAGPMVNETWGR
jgi:hypothetical protein